jgi:hypothetical protein
VGLPMPTLSPICVDPWRIEFYSSAAFAYVLEHDGLVDLRRDSSPPDESVRLADWKPKPRIVAAGTRETRECLQTACRARLLRVEAAAFRKASRSALGSAEAAALALESEAELAWLSE